MVQDSKKVSIAQTPAIQPPAGTVGKKKLYSITLCSALLLSTAIFAYTLYISYWKAWTGYGNEWGSLNILNTKPSASLSGGDLTHFKFGNISFEQQPYNLHWKLSAQFDHGDGIFERTFKETAPQQILYITDGLGPLYNAKSCDACHVADGRAAAASLERGFEGLLFRISIPGKNIHGGPKPHPVYGGQLADQAINGHDPEIKPSVRYLEITGNYPDGSTYHLRKPKYDLSKTYYGPLGEDAMISPRIAPVVIGMGLLDAIDPQAIEAIADPEDTDRDGISGKVNWVWDIEKEQFAVGKYGWKAETPTLRQQAADAAANDMGLTSELFPEQTCGEDQETCHDAPHSDKGNSYALDETQLNHLVVYLEFLAVPARDPVDHPVALRGEQLFKEMNCVSCHKQTWITGNDHRQWRLRNQTIHPYTDLLLHDMGEGLADNRPSFDATGTEWRTPPLWGIGMTERVNKHTNFLHDGRARNLEEAILWHDGEAKKAKEQFMQLPQADRDAVLAFLRTL